MDRHSHRVRLARAVLDGTAVDWAGEAAAGDPDLVEQLYIIGQVAHLHRQNSPEALLRTPESPRDTAHSGAPVRWHHLEILERLGRGAFGAVYRAWDPRLDREVALKIVAVTESGAADAPTVAIAEGKRLARIRHPGVVCVHGAEQIGREIGIWMELVPGDTLETCLERSGPFSVSDVVRIGGQLCAALESVHAAGLLHRDIKAQNVIRSADRGVVLVDFGAGHECENGAPAYVTGTPLYLAPEVLRGRPASVQSDVYSVGVLLYHLLTGHYPVRGETVSALARAHDTGVRVPLRHARRDVPRRLAGIVEKALDPNPAHRFRDAETLRRALATLDNRRLLSRREVLAVGITGAAAGAWWRRGGPPATGAGRRLAVLPFRAADGAEPSVVDGLSREIHATLTGLDGFELLSFVPSLRATAGRDDPVAAGRAVDADLVIHGAIAEPRPGAVQIGAALIRVRDGSVLWTSREDGSLPAVAPTHDEATGALIAQLRDALGLPLAQSIGVDAFEDFLRAREIQQGRGVNYLQESIALYQSVLARAPDYAPALSGLATALVDEARLTDKEPPARTWTAAFRARDLAPNHAGTQLAMGVMFAVQHRWPLADASFLRAIALDPTQTHASTEFVLSSLLPQTRYDDALDVLDRAMVRDPTSLDLWRVRALVEVDSTRYTDAIDSSRRVLDENPSISFAKLWLGRALALTNRLSEALEVYGDDPEAAAYKGFALARLGRTADALAMTARFEAEPYRQMLIYGGLGDKENAFEALARTIALNRWRAATWMSRPEVALLHDDPRYDECRTALGLPPHAPRSWWRQLGRRARTLVRRRS